MTDVEFIAKLDGAKRCAGGWVARCPSHDDRHASLSVKAGKDGRVLVNCHAGCEARAVADAVGVRMSELFADEQETKPSIVATYDYHDERGNLLYQVVRLWPKSFRQRRPDALDPDGWSWKLGDVQRVLYRHLELGHADPEELVFVVEGEKDVNRLRALALTATCNAGGAGKWRPEYSETLRGRDVVIVPDNDKPGAEHAEQVAKSLQGIALRVRVVTLGLDSKGADVSDWLAAGGDRDKLLALVADAPEWSPGTTRVIDGDGFVDVAARLQGERAERIADGQRKVPFNVSFLDDVCRGILPSDLVLVGARTGAGKTALATIIAQQAALQGRRVFFFALEAENREIERRLKYRLLVERMEESGVPDYLLARMNYLDWRLGFVDDIAGKYESAIDELIGKSYASLRTFYRRAKVFDNRELGRRLDEIREQADLVVLDHLHYVDADDDNENRAVGKIVKTVRDSALSSRKPVVVVAHLRKRDRGRVQLVPDEDDFHGTSNIGKIATRVVTIAPVLNARTESSRFALTFMAVRKDRPNSEPRWVSVLTFDRRTFGYAEPYALGTVNYAGDEWRPAERRPSWAKRANAPVPRLEDV